MRCNNKNYIVLWKKNINDFENSKKSDFGKKNILIIISFSVPFMLDEKYFLQTDI